MADDEPLSECLLNIFQIDYSPFIAKLGLARVEEVLASHIDKSFDENNPDNQFCFPIFDAEVAALPPPPAPGALPAPATELIQAITPPPPSPLTNPDFSALKTTPKSTSFSSSASTSTSKSKPNAKRQQPNYSEDSDTDTDDERYYFNVSKQNPKKKTEQPQYANSTKVVDKSRKQGYIKNYNVDTKKYEVLFNDKKIVHYTNIQIGNMLYHDSDMSNVSVSKSGGGKKRGKDSDDDESSGAEEYHDDDMEESESESEDSENDFTDEDDEPLRKKVSRAATNSKVSKKSPAKEKNVESKKSNSRKQTSASSSDEDDFPPKKKIAKEAAPANHDDDDEMDVEVEEKVVKAEPAAKSKPPPPDSSSDDDDDDDEDEKKVTKAEAEAKAKPAAKKPAATKKKPASTPDDDGVSSEDEFKVTMKATAAKAAKAASGWGFLKAAPSSSARKKPPPKKRAPAKKKSTGEDDDDDDDDDVDDEKEGKKVAIGAALVKVYEGDDKSLPVLSNPQDMFDDLVSKAPELADVVKTLGRPLRVATMCSGTESPILALDMIARACEEQYDSKLEVEHLFSCEIEPYKQAYIERNFQPPLLFRDIRELGRKQAVTAYGGLADVPGGVDILVAGTSCVDYSNLNNEKKEITGTGESGQTFRGMMDWILKNNPPIVIMENVSGAPWAKKVKIFEEELGYHATFARFDTKNYYIPHTRQRGYLFAVKKGQGVSEKALAFWSKLALKDYKRPASAALDQFMFPSDDPRVARGRQRLSKPKGEGKTGGTDWAKCEARHLYQRDFQDLGDKRPMSGWNDSGICSLPPFAWNEWGSAQVDRILDLMDINTLRMASVGVDATYKTNIWNLSQNVDRDTMGRLGLCQCLTPTGVPYVSNRGGPLVGEELLLLQGIPAEDLLLTRETQENLKDLAGNAMSTTVVGSVILAALIASMKALKPDGELNSGKLGSSSKSHAPSLVPRPLAPETLETKVTQEFAKYEDSRLNLSPAINVNVPELLQLAKKSCRRCHSEGRDGMAAELLVCKECGQTASSSCATPPRKYEEHTFTEFVSDRIDPASFQKSFLSALPMRIKIDGLSIDKIKDKPKGCDQKIWKEWCDIFASHVTEKADPTQAVEFSFRSIIRGEVWVAVYDAPGCTLELFMDARQPYWWIKIEPPRMQGPLRAALEGKAVARMVLSKNSKSLLDGKWEVCLPIESKSQFTFEGKGELVESWYARLGLQGVHKDTKRWSQFEVTVSNDGTADDKPGVGGLYTLLPKCGTACGSLHKRISEGNSELDVYMMIESGTTTLAEDDSIVFTTITRRLAASESRGSIVILKPGWRPTDQVGKQDVQGSTPGLWTLVDSAKLVVVDDANVSILRSPASADKMEIVLKENAWKAAPEIVSCTVPLVRESRLWKQCDSKKNNGGYMEINLQKSKKVFDELAWFTSRLSVPDVFSSWSVLSEEEGIIGGFDCKKCAPPLPLVKWSVVTAGAKTMFRPLEDAQEAGAYEQALKKRPNPFKVQLKKTDATGEMRIACNAFSLVQRARGLLPKASIASVAVKSLKRDKDKYWNFEWRIVDHKEYSTVPDFTNLLLTSNKKDASAAQPPNFKEYSLRLEQLRSLKWMLAQEATEVPYMEEEVSEAILAPLGWRAEGRAQRPVLARGGIVADQVGYGKTAITIGLIDAAESVNGAQPELPKLATDISIPTKATLIIVPSHLMGQWPKEILKFVGTSKKVLIIKDLTSLNKYTVEDFVTADIVVVNFTFLSNDKYHQRLARLAGANAGSLQAASKGGGRCFDAVYNQSVSGLENRCRQLKEDRAAALHQIETDCYNHYLAEQDATEAGLGMRMDGKKQVYKNVSEEKTKIESGAAATKKEGKATSSSSPSSKKTKAPAAKNKKELKDNFSWSKDEINSAKSKTDRDPWDLHTKEVQDNLLKMKCPPLELFNWTRIVVDEFHYLTMKADRARVLTIVLGLKSTFRWCLSGTPPHDEFADVHALAKLLGVHLGIEDTALQNNGKSRGRGAAAKDKDKTDSERFSNMLELRSMQWHERRHEVAQNFLDRFVRQNIAEIDEIPQEEHQVLIVLPPAERAVYLELETHLKNLEMNSGKAKKSKKTSSGDRAERMREALEDSADAEEALLKRCAHFDLAGNSQSAVETCLAIIRVREKQKNSCMADMEKNLEGAIRQREKICMLHKSWRGTKKGGQGEVEDRLEVFMDDVKKGNSVNGGADDEIHKLMKTILTSATDAEIDLDVEDPKYSISNTGNKADCEPESEPEDEEKETDENEDDDDDDEEEDVGTKRKKPAPKKKKKKKKKLPDARTAKERLYAMKYALREHIHEIRSLGKELTGRIRALRYFKWVLDFQDKEVKVPCNGKACKRACCTCVGGSISDAKTAGVVSSCGHAGCLKCLYSCADRAECVDPSCKQPVKLGNVISSTDLGAGVEHVVGGKWGAKLTALVEKVDALVKGGDRVVVFVQFKDLKKKCAEALQDRGVKTLQVSGAVANQIKALDVMQNENPEPEHPRVLLLTMDDESSSGVNLTTCNHAVFFHPLLADSQQQYDAYETQAIGRIRRYGQKKTVHIHRYLADRTIDTEIWKARGEGAYLKRMEEVKKYKEGLIENEDLKHFREVEVVNEE